MNRNFFIQIGERRLGFQYSPIVHADGGPYMTRYIVYLWFICLRLHKFYRGDHDRASHTHPWWFITFPFAPYREWLYKRGKFIHSQVVRSWRFHYRPANFEHVVKYGLEQTYKTRLNDHVRIRPFWTFVIAGGKPKPWGFYKPDGTFIFWRDYNIDAQEQFLNRHHKGNSMLPIDDKARKALPIFEGCVLYFPDALLAVSEVSRIGNDQHNPGQPLHWNRGKSMNQYDTAMRHLIDHRTGTRYDADGGRHLAKAAWRILAALQLDIEAEREEVKAEAEITAGLLRASKRKR